MEIPVQAEKESGWQIRQAIRRRDVERIKVAKRVSHVPKILGLFRGYLASL